MSICKGIIQVVSQNLTDILSSRRSFSEKQDGSYVSEGDLLIQELISSFLDEHLRSHELISEELLTHNKADWNDSGSYIVLDPIDGTENFVSGLKEWGVGISIYADGLHEESCIYLPELDEYLLTGMSITKFSSRIRGLSSSLTKDDLANVPGGYEYRIMGCSMYNMLSAIKGSFEVFENVKGVNCWDILPGLNLALEHGCQAEVDGETYHGQMLFPTKRYKIRISDRRK